MADSLFDQKDQDDQDYLAELTGPGGKFDRTKYTSEQEMYQAIAKGKVEGDRFIAHKNQEFDELRGEYTKVSAIASALPKLDDLVARLERRGSDNDDGTADTNADSGTPSLDPTKIEDLVTRKLAEMKAKELEEVNMERVESRLKDLYGDSAGKVLREKMNAYRITKEDLQFLAKRSPEAALNALGVNQQQRQDTDQELPRSSQRTDSYSTPTELRDAVYYEKLRRDNSKEYFSPKISTQRLKDMDHPDFLTRYRKMEAMRQRA